MNHQKESRKSLIKRYLLWCYKATKEELDRIDRKFTQLEVDRVILKELNKGINAAKGGRDAYLKKIEEFKDYIAKKENDAEKEKYISVGKEQLQPNYFYLTQRLAGIKEAIRSLLGSKQLVMIEKSYEEEMTRRILESREHT